jgi:2-methylcitrate dehydratase
MTGPEAAFTGRHGVFEQLTGEISLKPFGDEFLTPAIGLKFWPVENSAQSAVWAALELREAMPLAAIAGIDVAATWAAWHEIGSEPAKWDPKTRETADHSLPYIFARALVDDGITVAAFDEKSYLDPNLRPLMQKIRVLHEKSFDEGYPATVRMRVTATSNAGTTQIIDIVDPRGHWRNPMSDDEVARKFRGTAEPVLPAAKIAAALDMVWSLERAATMGPLFDLLEPA